jgi:hypothetical protein
MPSKPALIAIVALTWCLLACDPTNGVITQNTADFAVTVYYDQRNPSSEGLKMEPNELIRSSGMVGKREKKILADDPDDILIFCRAYSSRDLQNGVLRIEIRPGQLAC